MLCSVLFLEHPIYRPLAITSIIVQKLVMSGTYINDNLEKALHIKIIIKDV